MSKPAVRILFALDCEAIDQDVLKALTVLGEDQGVELTGLFIEDEDVLKAVRLPGVVEVAVSSGVLNTLSETRLSEQIQAQAQRARVEFENSTRVLDYKSNFRIVRGRSAESMSQAALESDVVVISRALRASGMRAWYGRQFELILSSHKTLMLPWLSLV